MKHFLFVIGLFSMLVLNGQNDMLSQKTIDTMSFRKVNRIYLTKIKQTLENDTTVIGWTKYYTFKSYVFLSKRENDSSLFYARKAIKIYNDKEKGYVASDGLIHKAYYIVGLREYFNGKTLQSISTLNTALSFTSKFPDSPDKRSWRYHILSRISTIHEMRGDYNLSLTALKKAAKDKYQMGFRYEGGNIYLNIGLCYDYLKIRDSAKYYYHRALKKYNDSTQSLLNNYTKDQFFSAIASVNGNLGYVFHQEKNLDSTMYYYQKGYNIMRENGLLEKWKKYSLTRFYTQVNYAFILSKKDSIDKSISILESIKDSLNSFSEYDRNEMDLRQKTHTFLSDIYAEKGLFSNAVNTYKELNKYMIDYEENSISKQLQMYTVEYDVEEKNKSILDLEKDKKQKNTIIKQQKLINIGTLVLLSLLLLFGIVFWRQNKIRNEFEKENLKQRLLITQMNPHFIFNSLNTVCSLVEKKSNDTISYINKLSKLFRTILNNSREDFVSLEEEIEMMHNYLELQSNFHKKFSFSIDIEESIAIEELIIPPMIIQPFLENAIIHGLPHDIINGEIKINIFKNNKNDLLQINIRDNGVGYSKTSNNLHKKKHKSVSISIVRERLKLLNKRFKINTRFAIKDNAKAGTSVELYLPFLLDN